MRCVVVVVGYQVCLAPFYLLFTDTPVWGAGAQDGANTLTDRAGKRETDGHCRPGASMIHAMLDEREADDMERRVDHSASYGSQLRARGS